MEATKKIRYSNLEILRIISMLLILLHHFYYNNISLDYSNLTVNQFLVQFLSTGGKIGVNCFVIITGYFMIQSKFKLRKMLKLMGQVWIYSIVGLIIASLVFDINIGIKDIIKCIFPIIYNNYWFITTYIIIYVFSDYINKFLKSISKKQYIYLLLILIFIWTILPTFMNGKIGFSDIDWFLLLYMIGAYIRLYKENINKDFKKRTKIVLTISICLSVISVVILDMLYNKLNFNPLHFALPMNQILPVLISICLFILFLNYKCSNNKIINKIASCTLGVYLIHTHILLRDIIWIKIFKVNEFINLPYVVLYEILVVIIIFIICTLIDYIRQISIEKVYMKMIDKVAEFYNTKFRNKVNCMVKKFMEEK